MKVGIVDVFVDDQDFAMTFTPRCSAWRSTSVVHVSLMTLPAVDRRC